MKNGLYSNTKRSCQWTSALHHTIQNLSSSEEDFVFGEQQLILYIINFWIMARSMISTRDNFNGIQDKLLRKDKPLQDKQLSLSLSLSLINRKGVVFFQDSARPHTAKVTRNKLNSLDWEKINTHILYDAKQSSTFINYPLTLTQTGIFLKFFY